MTYAAHTSVPASRSRAEVEELLRGAGALRFISGTEPDGAFVAFELRGRAVMFRLPLLQPSDFLRVEQRGRARVQSPAQMREHHEQHLRERWRGLLLCIRSKLVSIATGIETFDQAFLAHVVVHTDSGPRPFGQVALPDIQARAVPRLALPAAGDPDDDRPKPRPSPSSS